MAITKTDFINYSRCRRYVALEKVKSEKLLAMVSYEDYQKQELENKIEEMMSSIFEVNEQGNEIDRTEKVNKQLEAMLPYYKKVEEWSGTLVQKYFKGKTLYAKDTKNQVSFSFTENQAKYLCYVDVYNEQENGETNIIEVKATTSKKYVNLKSGYPKKEKYSIFIKKNNIYKLKGEIDNYPLEQEMSQESYQKEREKLFDRTKIGAYIYDLAVQRFIVEGKYKEECKEQQLPHIHYYLAVLNADYIYDGRKKNGKEDYQKDENGNEIITFFDFDEITREMQPRIKQDAKKIQESIINLDASPCPLSNFCGYKKQTCCKYFETICGSKIPHANSSLSYLNNGHGFLKEDGKRIKGLELINENYLDMLDVPEKWIHNKNHFIQRKCYQEHTQFIQKNKIKDGLASIEYPIYHLDFETFPCPLPRFKGEFPYIQSPFEFSLHIESSPGICDKQKDNVIFLASTFEDEREKLIQCLLENIDVHKGTLLAQNVSFEKSRIKELATIFPKYQKDLMKLYERGFDLLWLVNNNKELYKSLGYSKEESETINFYDERLSGSYSIKKTLPVFSDLSYLDLDVKNGTEAIIEYANYPNMTKEELSIKYEALRIYCQQDTWAMVEILDALRKLVS
ncbi:MAG: DUF2779 domain-containing protein [Bacilli bacterium]|nr:DUF2779 domain-containing protein [Bacilli bacterium]